MSAYDCCIVMPAYNEEGCIVPVVEKWSAAFRARFGGRFRFVVVNDGSRDRTGALLDGLVASHPELIVVHQANAGHGAALMAAYRAALALDTGWVFHVDSDDQFRPGDFGAFWERRETSPFLLGFRRNRHDALHRLVLTRAVRLANLLLFGAWIADANIPYRLIRRDYLHALLNALPAGLFAPNVFLSIMAVRDGRRVGSLPVTHEERRTGVVSILRWRLVKVCLRSFGELLRFRLELGSRLRALRSAGPSR